MHEYACHCKINTYFYGRNTQSLCQRYVRTYIGYLWHNCKAQNRLHASLWMRQVKWFNEIRLFYSVTSSQPCETELDICLTGEMDNGENLPRIIHCSSTYLTCLICKSTGISSKNTVILVMTFYTVYIRNPWLIRAGRGRDKRGRVGLITNTITSVSFFVVSAHSN